MIYQDENGDSNTDKAPKGGVISQSSVASSMTATIANPITYYGGAVINKGGHSGDLYNYYWTSYSRGTDGYENTNWHNVYLDGYIPLRVKSIYDPCPYLYRIPSNGTLNQFTNSGWTEWSYLGGVSWNLNTLGISWLSGLGNRNGGSGGFGSTGGWGHYYSSTAGGLNGGYVLHFTAYRTIQANRIDWPRSYGMSVRCIEGSLRSAFFSTVVDNNALGVQPILFVSKKYAKTAEPVERRLNSKAFQNSQMPKVLRLWFRLSRNGTATWFILRDQNSHDVNCAYCGLYLKSLGVIPKFLLKKPLPQEGYATLDVTSPILLGAFPSRTIPPQSPVCDLLEL